MKKQSLIKTGLAIVTALVMILISLTRYRTILPTGLAFMPLAGIIAIGLSLSLGAEWSIPVTILSVIIMIIIGTADWLVLIDFILILVVTGLVVSWRVPLNQTLTHQQLLRLAIFIGLFQLLIMVIMYGLVGLVVTGSMMVALTFIGLILPNALLTGLLYAFLGAPIALGMRWLAKKLLKINDHHHPDSGDDDHQAGSIIIDLSSKKDHQDKK